MPLSRAAAMVALSMNTFIAISALCTVVLASDTTCSQELKQRLVDDAASLLQVKQSTEKGIDRGLVADSADRGGIFSEDRAESGDWNCGEGGTKVIRMPGNNNGLTAVKASSTGSWGLSKTRCFYLLACKTSDDPRGKLFLVWTVLSAENDGSCTTGTEKNHASLETPPEALDDAKVTVDIIDSNDASHSFEMTFPNPEKRNEFITLEKRARAQMDRVYEIGLATARVNADDNQPSDALSQALRTLVLRNYDMRGSEMEPRPAGCKLSDDTPPKLMCSQTYPPNLDGSLADMSSLMTDLTNYKFPRDLLAMMNSRKSSQYNGLHMSSRQQNTDALQEWATNPKDKEMAAVKFFSRTGSDIFHQLLQRRIGNTGLPIWEDVAVMLVLTASYLNKMDALDPADAGLDKGRQVEGLPGVTEQDYTLYRYSGNGEGAVFKASVGKVFRSEQFVSTTKKYKGWGGLFEWVIKVPANGRMSGKDIQPISDKPREQEVLFPPGALFKVITAEAGAQTALVEAVEASDLTEDDEIVTRRTVNAV